MINPYSLDNIYKNIRLYGVITSDSDFQDDAGWHRELTIRDRENVVWDVKMCNGSVVSLKGGKQG